VQDRGVLRALQVQLVEEQPVRMACRCSSHAGLGMRWLQLLSDLQLPAVVLAAAERASNGSAALLCARVLSARCATKPAHRRAMMCTSSPHTSASLYRIT
jgi:hypothetical protein